MGNLQLELFAMITARGVILGAALCVLTFCASLAVISFILVKVPPTYFQSSHPRDFWVERHAVIRWAGVIGKNLLGVVLVLLGIVMSIPGVPGQGVLTILLGVMLLDFPGKRQLEYKLVSRPMIQEKINHLRKKFGKPPLVLD
jgi:hypothetical protein